MSDLLILAPAALVFVVLILVRHLRAPRTEEDGSSGPPPNAIVVDGSNIMHWAGDPSSKVLSKVLRSIEQAGLAPIVFFDANVGYILGDRYFDEAHLAKITGVPEDHICVVSKGMTADEGLLAFARDHHLRVVSNDRYRDWRVRFPHLSKKGAVVRGTYRDGTVVWRGKL